MWNLFKPDSWRSRAWATELLAPLTCRKEIERRSIAIERERERVFNHKTTWSKTWFTILQKA